MRIIPQASIDLIRTFEGCSYAPYRDGAGKLTIGIGHLIKDGENFSTITQEEAEAILRTDMHKAASSVCNLISRQINDNQYSALLSFTFNLGGGSLQRSRLRIFCNRKDDAAVIAEFIKWDKVAGRKSPGLRRRRIAEAMLYGKD